MAKCCKCNVEILDESEYCPLCRSVLEQTDEVENMYPDARVTMRKRMFFGRLYLFCCILAELCLISINVMLESRIWWSAITGLGLLYSYLVLRYAILGRSGYRGKVIVLSLIAILSAIAVDFIIGYRGWSVDYVMPLGILAMDLVILGCMIFNRRNWQSYMMWQIAMIFCSLIPATLNLFELEKNRHMAFLPLALSLVIFFGTLILGGRRATVELKRRFHVN